MHPQRDGLGVVGSVSAAQNNDETVAFESSDEVRRARGATQA